MPAKPRVLAGLACPVAVAVGLVLAACGATKSGLPAASLVLDFTPNAVHAGIYSAHARGYDRAAGVDLKIITPGSSTDSVKLLLSHRVDFAVLDIHDLAIARAAGQDIVGVLPLVQRPLAAVLAQPQIRTPRDLEGREAGVSGLPSDVAVLDSTVAGAGGDPAKVKRVTIGFNAVPALLGGHVAAVTAFWDVEGIALHRARPATREFRVDDYGAPAYPELVLCVDGQTLRRQAKLVDETVGAIRRGYALTISNPAASADDELAANPDLDRSLFMAELSALRGAFTGGPGQAFGVFDQPRLRAWASWEAHFGIVRKVPDVATMFATLPPSS
ncbi:MAG TPA: ABC transporter substrate-binding protein [Solirubrobacteraceae bacterium]|jgi:ABC-type nitrate/sulfonate/bicarbonate transport system substrate-binding protein|nr:ABC transporter substrate-binding protein [Solirubrobacteraceae bacterium]